MAASDARTGMVGLIANPVSARDIRRVVANASSLQVADRTNIVLRGLAALAATGVDKVLAMPDKKGIRALLERAIYRERNLGHVLPHVEFLDMPVTSSVEDTRRAAAAMAARGVDAIIVLGGDGTHRAVVAASPEVPIAGLSTGTNNAYPDMRESTITGLAVGLYVRDRVPGSVALLANKLLEVHVEIGARRTKEVALVDVVASRDRYVGARALWKIESVVEVFATFADPEAVGMSSIAGVIRPVGRSDPFGLHVELTAPTGRRVTAPIGPGMVREVGIGGWSTIEPDRPMAVSAEAGTLALDGERELELEAGSRVTVTLRTDAFRSVDVGGVMRWAAANEALFSAAGQTGRDDDQDTDERRFRQGQQRLERATD